MISNKRDAARRNLLNCVPRTTLERLSGHESAWSLRRPELLQVCVDNWDEAAVRASIDRLFMRAAGPDKPKASNARARV